VSIESGTMLPELPLYWKKDNTATHCSRRNPHTLARAHYSIGQTNKLHTRQ
jgi:hypothetical protein